MVSKVEGEFPTQAGKIPPLPSPGGTLVGRVVAPAKAVGFYCVTMPMGLGARVLSLAGSGANQLTFRPVVSSLSAVGWLGGLALYLAGRVTEVTGKMLQTNIARRVGEESSKYTETYFQRAMGIRTAVGEATDHVVSYVPFVGGPVTTLERGERAAEAALSAGGSGVLTRMWRIATSLLPLAGALEYLGKTTALASRKIVDLTYLGMTEPSRLNQVFQNFRDRMDSYAFHLLEAQEPPRPVISLCTEGDFKRFIRLGKNARRRIFQAVTTSPWLRIPVEEKKVFSEALKRRGVRRTPEDKQALRVMYSAYLSLTDLQKEREKLSVGEIQFQAFLESPEKEQENRLFMVLSSPMWDVSRRDQEKFQTAFTHIQDARAHHEHIRDEDAKLIREMLGMYERLPTDYLCRALTPHDCDTKLHALDPVMARIRIMNVVRECASGLSPQERRLLAKYRKIKQLDDWLTLDEASRRELEKTIFFHFNRLSLKNQEKLYDVTPEQVWDLQKAFRTEFFREGQKLLLAQGSLEFEGVDPEEFMKEYSHVVAFTEALNTVLRLEKKVELHQMVTPPPTVIAFTEEQLRIEIAAVKTRLGSAESLDDQERRQLTLYLMMLEATMQTRETFVPIEEVETPVSKKEVFGQQVRAPVDLTKLQSTVGNEVVTSGVLYTAGRALGMTEELAGKGIGGLLEKLFQGVGLASHPALVRLMFGAFSFGISFFSSEERVISALKILGIEEKVRGWEANAAQVFPLMLKLSAPLERLLLSGVTATKDWMTAITRAMRIVGDPGASAEQIQAVTAELTAAKDGVCAAAMSLGESGRELVHDVQAATDILLQQCAMGGTSGLLRAAEGQLPSVSTAATQAAVTIRQALAVRNVVQPQAGILAAVKRLWYWGASSFQPPSAESLAEVQELAQKLTLLEQAGHASERVQSLKTLLEVLPPVRALTSTSAAQTLAFGYLSVGKPLLDIIQKGLELEQGILSLGGDAVIGHLKWVDLAREAERYATEGGDALMRLAEEAAGNKEGVLKYAAKTASYVAKTASYALPVVYSMVLGTGGFVLTPLFLAFLANDLVPAAGVYLAPRMRPMWNYLGAISRQGVGVVGKQVAEASFGMGYYLQRAVNSGRYVDPKRIENFKNVLSDKEREFLFHAVRMSSKIAPEDGEEIESQWALFRAKKLDTPQETALITRLLLGFEDVSADELLAMNPFYYSMLAPYVQERLVDIVERYNPLTIEEKKSANYLQILVDRFKGLSPGQRDEINIIPPWEYHNLSEEEQRELRFLIVHSKDYQRKMEQGRAEKEGGEAEEMPLRPGELLAAFEREPKGEELREFLCRYRDLDPSDLAGITPQQLVGVGEAKILHALSIVEAYHARWIRTLAETDGRDVSLLRDIIKSPHPRSVVMELQKKRLVEALASLCRQMPDYQQSYLLDMTEQEVAEMSADSEKLEKCFQHLLTYTTGTERKDELTRLLGTYKRKLDLSAVTSLFNALSEQQKAEFRQGVQPRTDAIESVRSSLLTTNVELIELTDVAEKTKYSLESLITASELIGVKAKGRLTHQDEVKVQRFQLNASAYAAKLEVLEKRIGELLAVREKLIEALERVGVKDIPLLPLEEIEKHNPQRRLELLLVSQVVDLEVSASIHALEQQSSVRSLDERYQFLLEHHARRMAEGHEAIATLERQNAEFQAASSVGSSIAKAKAKASSILIEKKIHFMRSYLQTFEERFKEVESTMVKRRKELSAQ